MLEFFKKQFGYGVYMFGVYIKQHNRIIFQFVTTGKTIVIRRKDESFPIFPPHRKYFYHGNYIKHSLLV